MVAVPLLLLLIKMGRSSHLISFNGDYAPTPNAASTDQLVLFVLGFNITLNVWFGNTFTSYEKILPIIEAVYPINFAQNVLTTGLIAYKIFRQHRTSQSIGLNVSHRISLIHVMRIIVESALIYTFELMLLIILSFLKSPVQYIVQAAIIPSVGEYEILVPSALLPFFFFYLYTFIFILYQASCSYSSQSEYTSHETDPQLHPSLPPSSLHGSVGTAKSYSDQPIQPLPMLGDYLWYLETSKLFIKS